MAIAAVTLVVLLDAISATLGWSVASLSMGAIAQASSRPQECETAASPGTASSPGQPHRPNLWQRVREPKLGLYCDRLARGYGELGVDPEQAYREAESAGQILPGRAAPWVLKARSSTRLGKPQMAVDEFQRARSLDSHALDEPGALRDWAAVLARTGRTEDALGAYRALGPRLSLAFGTEEQAAILLEAAELASSLGPAGLADAVAFLDGARQLPARLVRLRVLAELALALDRQGESSQALSVAGLVPRRTDGSPALDGTEDGVSDLDAAIALLTESWSTRTALERWVRYLRGPASTGPWAGHAVRHRDELLGRRASEPLRRSSPSTTTTTTTATNKKNNKNNKNKIGGIVGSEHANSGRAGRLGPDAKGALNREAPHE